MCLFVVFWPCDLHDRPELHHSVPTRCSSYLTGMAWSTSSSQEGVHQVVASRRGATSPSTLRATSRALVRAAGLRRSAWTDSRMGGSRSEEHTSELQSLMRITYAVFCLKKKTRAFYALTNHTNSLTVSQ